MGARLPELVTYLYLVGVAIQKERQAHGHDAGE
jgi:hypothetical protein